MSFSNNCFSVTTPLECRALDHLGSRTISDLEKVTYYWLPFLISRMKGCDGRVSCGSHWSLVTPRNYMAALVRACSKTCTEIWCKKFYWCVHFAGIFNCSLKHPQSLFMFAMARTPIFRVNLCMTDGAHPLISLVLSFYTFIVLGVCLLSTQSSSGSKITGE